MTSASLPTQLKNFLPLSKLGQGAFSTVYKVKRTNDNQIYALKKIKIQKLTQKQKINALNQIRILASIKSNYIISYKQAFYDQSLNLLCIVMEYANGGDLQKIITDHKKSGMQFAQKQIWRAAAQILVALHVLHQRGILHRDLKSANVFVSNDKYKLGDLNVSKINDQKDQMARTQTGTPYYASPEVWRDQPYDSKCDIWSLGCLVYEMCCSEPPFQGHDLDDLYKNVQRGKFQDIPRIYSEELASLIKLCLQVNPKLRPSAKELFGKFRKLNQKYAECIRINQFQSDSKLINTIRLPHDINQLSKNLPLPEYETNTKNEPQNLYSSDPQNKETVMLKNRPINEENHQKIAPLPERIKKYFNNANNAAYPKRPERPRTSSKQKCKKQNNEFNLRPSSAYVKKITGNEQEIKLNPINRNKHKIIPLSNQQSKPLPPLISKPTSYNPNQYRCKSSESHRQPRLISQITSPKERIPSANSHQNKQVFSSQKPSIEQSSTLVPTLQQNLSLNKKLYENCKQNSLKKISSLQKKVRYIRDQRKQRKGMLQKNKENLSCVFKKLGNQERLDMKQCLKDKIRMNSEVFRPKQCEKVAGYMPIIRQKVNSAALINKPHQLSELSNDPLKVILQKRNDNLANRRYIASADSKRVRSYTQASNEQCVTKDNQKIARYLMPVVKKKIDSHLPSSLSLVNHSNNTISVISNKSYIIKSQKINDYHQKPNKNTLENTKCEKGDKSLQQKDLSLIDDSQAILRLKRRIKNRMIGQQSEVRSQLRADKHYYNRVM